MSDHGLISSYEGHKERRTGKNRELFSGMHRALDSWMLARALAPPTQGLHHHGPRIFNFHIFLQCVALRNLDLLIKTDWNVFLSDLLPRTLVVGRRQQSEYWQPRILLGLVEARSVNVKNTTSATTTTTTTAFFGSRLTYMGE